MLSTAEHFKKYFPAIAEKTKFFIDHTAFELYIYTFDNIAYLYNDRHKTIRRLQNSNASDILKSEKKWKREFSYRLKECIDVSGKSIEEIAKDSKISQQIIYNYISEKTIPSLLNACKLAESLSCDVNDFINFPFY